MILVSGGAGFIGSHTAVSLLEKGYEIVIADNLSNSRADVVENISKICGKKPILEVVDLSNLDECHNLFEKYKNNFEAVIHFAASKYVEESTRMPLLYYRNNISSLANVLCAMREFSCKNIVFSSSCTVYGKAKELPVTEESPYGEITSPYGNTKKICEEIIRDCCKANLELGAVILRYFNPIGAHPSALIGELPNGVPSNLMPFITQTAAGIRKELLVFGSDYNTPDGTPIRDYIHVCDLAKAHVAALEYMRGGNGSESTNLGSAKTNYEVFNIGTGKGYGVFDVIRSFEKTSGKKLNYRVVERRNGDVEQIWADPSKAEKVLNWKATQNLDQMTLSAWKWQESLSHGN